MRVNTRYKDIPLVEFMYLVFTRMPGESYCRLIRSLLLYSCYICVCWGGNTKSIYRWRLEELFKKEKEKKKEKKRKEKKKRKKRKLTNAEVGKPLDTIKTLHEKRQYNNNKILQILNDATLLMRHYFYSRRSDRSGRFILPRTNSNRYKTSFLPSAL